MAGAVEVMQTAVTKCLIIVDGVAATVAQDSAA